MADKKQTASGAAGGGNDTSFRKTYDRTEYAAKAKESERKRKEDGAKFAEAKASGKAWHRAATPEDMKDTSHRVERLDVAANVGRVTLVPAGGQGKRGRGAGFYCSHCDETYKDSHSYVEHQNSTQHLRASGQSGEVRRANAAECHERLRYLKRKLREERTDQVVNLDARLELSRENEEKEREEKRRKRNEKRRKTPGGVGHVHIKIENDGIIS